MYIIKFPYTNGNTLLITGISFGGEVLNRWNKLRQRLQIHHSSHGAAGEVLIIEGDVGGNLKRFEDMMKIHFRSERPDSGVNGTETYLCSSNEAADSIANKILGWAERYTTSGSLTIPTCCSTPNGGMISSDPEAPDFYKKNKVALSQTKITMKCKKGVEKKRDSVLGK